MQKTIKWVILFLLLVLPYVIYTYISKGQHSFKELAVIGETDHMIPPFSFLNQDINGRRYVGFIKQMEKRNILFYQDS